VWRARGISAFYPIRDDRATASKGAEEGDGGVRRAGSPLLTTVTETATKQLPVITPMLPHPEVPFLFAMASSQIAIFPNLLIAILAVKSSRKTAHAIVIDHHLVSYRGIEDWCGVPGLHARFEPLEPAIQLKIKVKSQKGTYRLYRCSHKLFTSSTLGNQ